MLATRLYQNTARIHFDAHRAEGNAVRAPAGLRRPRDLALPRALATTGSRTPSRSPRSTAARHANPTFAGDTLYCRHVVLARMRACPAARDVGALRLRMLGVKNLDAGRAARRSRPASKHTRPWCSTSTTRCSLRAGKTLK